MHHEFDAGTIEQVAVVEEVLVPALVVDLHFRDEYIQRLVLVFKVACLDAYVVAVFQMNKGILEERCSYGVFICARAYRVEAEG